MLLQTTLLLSLLQLSKATLHLSPDSTFSLIDSTSGISQLTRSLSVDSAPNPKEVATLDETTTLKLSFVVSNEQGEGLQPSQAAVLWEPVESELKGVGREFMMPVKIRKGGKGKAEIDFSRVDVRLLSVTTGPMTASLLLGDASEPKGLAVPLGTFILSPSLALPYPYPGDETLPKTWEVERHAKMPEMQWTFRKAEKKVAMPLALLGLVFVLTPWVVLVSAATHLKPTLSSPTLHTLSFLLCIVSFESLVVAYWTSLKLIPTLPYFGLLAILTAFTGRKALSEMRVKRLAREGAEKKKN